MRVPWPAARITTAMEGLRGSPSTSSSPVTMGISRVVGVMSESVMAISLILVRLSGAAGGRGSAPRIRTWTSQLQRLKCCRYTKADRSRSGRAQDESARGARGGDRDAAGGQPPRAAWAEAPGPA